MIDKEESREKINYKPTTKEWPEDFDDKSKELIEIMAKEMIYPYYSKKNIIFFRGVRKVAFLNQKKEEIVKHFKFENKENCEKIRKISKLRAAQLRTNKPIKTWLEEERPRERLVKYGAENLSDAHLLAIILRVGNPNISAVDLARNIIEKFGNLRKLETASITELQNIEGIGIAKAAGVKAALEMGKRFLRQKSETRKRIKTNEDVVNYYKAYLRDLEKEVFKVMLLDGRNKIIKDITSDGGLNNSIVDPKIIIKEAIRESASALILVHNHPSGESEPSEDDIEITNRLIKACDLVGLRVLDHIIIGNDNYTSFLDKGLIKED